MGCLLGIFQQDLKGNSVLKKSLLVGALLLANYYPYCSGQEFEAASIKPSPAFDSSAKGLFWGSKGGPGTPTPTRYWCNFCTASDLISEAYDTPAFRLANTKILHADRFHIAATIAPNTTQEQFRLMLQNLLADRFGVKLHHETREMRVLRLQVSRGGAKLKPHSEGTPVQAKPIDEKAPPGWHFRKQATLADFAKIIESQLHKPVVDATGLVGKYDFDLAWRFDDLDEQNPSNLPSFQSAIRSLGLEIDSHLEQTEVLVIDEIAKSPSKD
jgi:uncharacterized protein (TIGR03435 family)